MQASALRLCPCPSVLPRDLAPEGLCTLPVPSWYFQGPHVPKLLAPGWGEGCQRGAVRPPRKVPTHSQPAQAESKGREGLIPPGWGLGRAGRDLQSPRGSWSVPALAASRQGAAWGPSGQSWGPFCFPGDPTGRRPRSTSAAEAGEGGGRREEPAPPARPQAVTAAPRSWDTSPPPQEQGALLAPWLQVSGRALQRMVRKGALLLSGADD